MAGSNRMHVAAAIALLALFGIGFTNTATAASAKEIDLRTDVALARFYDEVSTGKAFLENAKAILVFPYVIKAGIGIGGEYGEGALRIGGKTVEYYKTVSGSIGLQLGAQSKTIIVVFLDEEALAKFRSTSSTGWEVGVNGSVNLMKTGAGGSIDITNVEDPIVGFVLTNRGLMFNMTLEGSKFVKIDR